MKAVVNSKKSLLAVLLAGVVLAASASVDAATPWFRPGGFRPVPHGNRNRESAPERNQEQRRNRYSEQRFIRYLYQGFLNRQPSSGELRTWSDRLGRDANPTELVQEFMDSDEFFIRETYRGLLGREPDANGMATYMRLLRDGGSRAEVVEAFLTSPEFNGKLR